MIDKRANTISCYKILNTALYWWKNDYTYEELTPIEMEGEVECRQPRERWSIGTCARSAAAHGSQSVTALLDFPYGLRGLTT